MGLGILRRKEMKCLPILTYQDLGSQGTTWNETYFLMESVSKSSKQPLSHFIFPCYFCNFCPHAPSLKGGHIKFINICNSIGREESRGSHILRKLKKLQSLLLWKLLWKSASNGKKNGGSWVKSLELWVLDLPSSFIQVFLKFWPRHLT